MVREAGEWEEQRHPMQTLVTQRRSKQGGVSDDINVTALYGSSEGTTALLEQKRPRRTMVVLQRKQSAMQSMRDWSRWLKVGRTTVL